MARGVDVAGVRRQPDSDIFGEPPFGGEDERLGARARAKGNGRAEGEGVGEEEEALSPYRGNKNFAPPHLPNGTYLFPTHRDWRYGGATRARIDESPVIRGTRSLLRQNVPRKPPRNMRSSWLRNGSDMDRATM